MASAAQIDRAVDVLERGGIVAFPTETVYGLGAWSSHVGAVERIFRMKGRPRSRALIIHLDSPAAMDNFASEIPDYAWKLAKAFWPGPLTLVLPKRESVGDDVTAGSDTVGVRVPNHPVALELISKLCAKTDTTAGVAAPSANRFGEPPATTAQEVVARLGAPATADTAPDLILDGGSCPGRVPSTILSCVGAWPRILRRGATSPEAIEEVIGRWVDQ